MFNSYRETRAALESGKTTCRKLVSHYLEVIRQKEHLNAFVEVYEAEALEKADALDQKFTSGKVGRLAGMVVGVKDVICHENHGAQAGSNILEGFISQYSATVVARIDAEDAIIIGRQNCDEFGMGSSNENSAFGHVKNNIDETRVPGGSSGASAVAVSAGMCLTSLGTDTGGSVRQPAAFCGVVGFKPSYSRISRYGLIAYASSFDTIGVLATNAEDVAHVLAVIAGKDEFDATVSTREVPDYPALLQPTQAYKIGYIKETIESEGIDPKVKAATLQRIEALKAAGHQVEEVQFELLDYVLPTYYILTTAEASTNLSRFDGVRYGHRSPESKDLASLYKKSRSEGFGSEVKRRIMLGTFVLSASYYDAYFTKAQKVRRLIKEKTEALLKEYDFLVMPTSPTTAFEIGKFDESDPVAMYLADLYTVQASVAGVPAISIPNGVDENNLPIGFQLVANAFEEGKLLNFAHQLMQKEKA